MKTVLAYVIACLTLAAVSCNKADIEETGTGVLAMEMSIDSPVTKASMGTDELTNTAKVKIYRDKKGLVRSYTMQTMPSPFYLASGDFDYRVDVEAGEIVKENPARASWEQKSYKGSQRFRIVAKQVTNVSVAATVSNAVTMITFSPTVAENFEDGYSFTIGLDSDDSDTQLIYGAENSGAEGYFIIDGIKKPTFSWEFAGTLRKDGSDFKKTGTIPELSAGRLYKMNLVYTVKDGELGFTLMVDDSYSQVFNERIEFEPVSTGLEKSEDYEHWATKTTLHALVDQTDNEDKKVEFAYRSGSGEWTYVDGVYNSTDRGNYHASVSGLTPSTEYEYKLVLDGADVGESMTFTTDDAPNLPNASFEYYSQVPGHELGSGDKPVYRFFDPSCSDVPSQTKFWASGNGDEGSSGNIFPADHAIITTIDTGESIDGDCSVVAQSQKAMGIALAAGNLFTGQFISASLNGSTQSGIVNFGRPWTSRPSALKIFCKYTTGAMDFVGDNLPEGVSFVKNESLDRAQIKVAIGTWKQGSRERGGYGGTKDSPVQVVTSDSNTFVDFYTDSNTIANGDIIIYKDGYDINKKGKVSKDTGAQWMELIIPLDYRENKLNIFPTHIIISCAASQYGDYFTGCSSSKLWLDAFELIYE